MFTGIIEDLGAVASIKHTDRGVVLAIRTALPLATALEPAVVIADEPTASLDTERGREVIGLLAELAHGRGSCVIAASHDPRPESGSDSVLGIADGLVLPRS